jgi:hypothetical protein
MCACGCARVSCCNGITAQAQAHWLQVHGNQISFKGAAAFASGLTTERARVIQHAT